MQIKERLGIETIGQLREYPLTALEKMFGIKNGCASGYSLVFCSFLHSLPLFHISFPPSSPCASFLSLYSSWLYDLCRGDDHEPVRPRKLAQSIGCGKNFRGREKLDTVQKVRECVCVCACVPV